MMFYAGIILIIAAIILTVIFIRKGKRAFVFLVGYLLLPVPCFMTSYTFNDTLIAGLSLSFLVSIISGSLAVGGVGSAEHNTNGSGGSGIGASGSSMSFPGSGSVSGSQGSSGGSFGGGGASGSW